MAGISTFLDESLLPGRAMEQKAFDAAVAYVMQNWPRWGREINETLASMASLAAGGVYAIPYRYVNNATSNGSAVGGVLGFGAAQVLVDTKSARGDAVGPTLLSTAGSTSATKGLMRIVRATDPTKWRLFAVNGYTQNGGGLYGVYDVSFVDSTTSFVDGEAVLMFFQRTGDKGDTSAATPVLWVRDIRVAGAYGDNAAAGGSFVRALNDTKKNTIPGATISGNRVTLPAGTYRGGATASAYAVNAHQCYLYNVTSSAVTVEGSSARAAGGVVSESEIAFIEFTITGVTSFELRHFTEASSSGRLGSPSSNGALSEVYAQLYLEKIA